MRSLVRAIGKRSDSDGLRRMYRDIDEIRTPMKRTVAVTALVLMLAWALRHAARVSGDPSADLNARIWSQEAHDAGHRNSGGAVFGGLRLLRETSIPPRAGLGEDYSFGRDFANLVASERYISGKLSSRDRDNFRFSSNGDYLGTYQDWH